MIAWTDNRRGSRKVAIGCLVSAAVGLLAGLLGHRLLPSFADMGARPGLIAAAQARTPADTEGLSLKAFDAACDGIADDSAAIRAWLSEVVLSGRPGFIPGGGVCNFASPLPAFAGDDIVVHGDGFRSSVLQYSGSGDGPHDASRDLITLGSDARFTGSIEGTRLTVSALSKGVIAIGAVISAQGVAPNTRITAYDGGSGGPGTYRVSASQTVAATGMSTPRNYNLTLGGFTVGSRTPLGSGFALRVRGYINVWFNLDLNGKGAHVGNLWDGLWVDGSSQFFMASPQFYARHTGVAAQACTELHFGSAWIGGARAGGGSAGAHIGGGCGGVYFESATELMSEVGVLVDTALERRGNDQLFFGSSVWDSNTRAAAYVDDAISNPVGKSIDLGRAWFASTSQGNGLTIAQFKDGSVYGAGSYRNNAGCGIALDDASVDLQIALGTSLQDNRAQGLCARNPVTIHSAAVPRRNVGGAYAANVTVEAPTAAVKRAPALSTTVTLRTGTSVSTCTLTFTAGVLTASSC